MYASPKEITRALDRVLHTVAKPARYTGGELNSIPKDWADPSIHTKIALAFPDIYELGGSNLGLMLLYDLINKRPDLLAERVYRPWPDFEEPSATSAASWVRSSSASNTASPPFAESGLSIGQIEIFE